MCHSESPQSHLQLEIFPVFIKKNKNCLCQKQRVFWIIASCISPSPIGIILFFFMFLMYVNIDLPGQSKKGLLSFVNC